MKYKLDRDAHSIYSLHYHLIFVVKYRRKVFTNDKIIDFLKQEIGDDWTSYVRRSEEVCRIAG